MGRRKISIVGAGNVGATTAQRLAERNYADLVLVDNVEGLAQGKALDLLQAGPLLGYDCHVQGSTGYDETAGSDLVILTCGLSRREGMSRDDLLARNTEIVAEATREVASRSPRAQILVVSSPLDAMTWLAWSVSGFPPGRVYGMAGVLDTARFRSLLAAELKVSVETLTALVLGGHGDTMVPVVRCTTMGGIPVENLLSSERLDALVERTRTGGAEIVGLLKTGSAFYAPSAAVVEMVDAVLFDKKKVMPVCAYLTGQYGLEDLYVGVPARMGAGGVEEIVEIDLAVGELRALRASAAAVAELVDQVRTLM